MTAAIALHDDGLSNHVSRGGLIAAIHVSRDTQIFGG